MQGNMAELFRITPKQEEAPRKIARCYGADGRIRTGDLILTKDALYLLSYISAVQILSDARIIIQQDAAKSNT